MWHWDAVGSPGVYIYIYIIARGRKMRRRIRPSQKDHVIIKITLVESRPPALPHIQKSRDFEHFSFFLIVTIIDRSPGGRPPGHPPGMR